MQPAEAYVFSRATFAWDGLDTQRVWVIPPSIHGILDQKLAHGGGLGASAAAGGRCAGRRARKPGPPGPLTPETDSACRLAKEALDLDRRLRLRISAALKALPASDLAEMDRYARQQLAAASAGSGRRWASSWPWSASRVGRLPRPEGEPTPEERDAMALMQKNIASAATSATWPATRRPGGAEGMLLPDRAGGGRRVRGPAGARGRPWTGQGARSRSGRLPG